VRQLVPEQDERQSVEPGRRVVTELDRSAAREQRCAVAQLPTVEVAECGPRRPFGVHTPAYDDPGTSDRGQAAQLGAAVAGVAGLGAGDEAALDQDITKLAPVDREQFFSREAVRSLIPADPLIRP